MRLRWARVLMGLIGLHSSDMSSHLMLLLKLELKMSKTPN